MALQSVIFDLDQTLVDSSALELYRKAKLWDVVMAQLDRIVLYPGIADLWQQCRAANLKMAVFTNSPRHVCEAVLQKFNLQPDAIVAFGEVNFPKPSRAPAIRALELIGMHAYTSAVIGDRCVDIISGRNAGVGRTIGAEWGTQDARALLLSHPTFSAATVEQTRQLVAGLLDPTTHRQWLTEKEAETTARFNQELWEGHEHDVARGRLQGGVFPYYFCRQRFKGPWFTSYANMLVKNLKFVGPATGPKHRAKMDSCSQMARELTALHRTLNFPNTAFAFVPGSKQRGHPEFDTRFDYVGAHLTSGAFRVTEPIVTSLSHDAVHSDEDNYEERDPAVIRQHLEWRGFGENVPDNVILVDDVITSGGHFRACVEMIRENHPTTNVVGAFWAAHISG